MPGARLQVTLADEALDFVRSKVESGEFASESEVLEAGVAELRRRESATERWMREVAVPAYDRIQADPSRGIPLDEVRAELAADLRGMEVNR